MMGKLNEKNKDTAFYKTLIVLFAISGIAYGMNLDVYWFTETFLDPIFSPHIYKIRQKAKLDPDVGLSIFQIMDKYGYDADGLVNGPSSRLLNQDFVFRQCDRELLYSGTGKRQPEPLFIGFKDLKCFGVVRGDLARVLPKNF